MKKYFNYFLFSISIGLTACSGFEGGGSGGNGATNVVTLPGWVTITEPAENAPSADGLTLIGSCDPSFVVDLSGEGLLSPATTTCDNGTFTVIITFTSGDGRKNIIASQTDGSDTTASDSRIFMRDSTAPAVAITGPGVNASIAATFTLVGSCESGLPVNISGAGISAPTTATCTGGNFSSTVAASANDGTKNFVVTQTDAAGNVGSANRNFARNSAAPVITITQPATNTEAAAGVTLQGTCTNGLVINLSGTGLQGPNTTTCANRTFSVAITFTANNGQKTITAAQTNIDNVTGSDSRKFIRNNTSLPYKCGGSVNLTWVAPTRNTDDTPLVNLAGFKIYYGVSSGAFSTVLDVANAATTTRTISGLAPGRFYVAMTAYNSMNVESNRTGEIGLLLIDCMTTTVNLLTGEMTYSPYSENNNKSEN